MIPISGPAYLRQDLVFFQQTHFGTNLGFGSPLSKAEYVENAPHVPETNKDQTERVKYSSNQVQRTRRRM